MNSIFQPVLGSESTRKVRVGKDVVETVTKCDRAKEHSSKSDRRYALNTIAGQEMSPLVLQSVLLSNKFEIEQV